MEASFIDAINPLTTLTAAFAGAWCAFKLEARYKQEEEKKVQIAAGNRAISVLMQQANTLKLFQIDWLSFRSCG
jgi:hypothetical protein